jgi:hypothetical protein
MRDFGLHRRDIGLQILDIPALLIGWQSGWL